MQDFQIVFSPELPLWLAALLAVAIFIFCVYGIARSVRGAWFRATAGAILAASLFNPVLTQEERRPLKTIVPVVVDATTSQKLDDRAGQTAAALVQLRERFGALPDFELREITVRDRISRTSDVSTSLFAGLSTLMQDIPVDQVGGAIFLTDGQVHDLPANIADTGLNGPLHVLLSGKPEEKDRRIVLENAPRFGVVGESQELVYRIEQTGFARDDQDVEVEILLDGEEIATELVRPGVSVPFVFDVPHGGKNIVELRAAVEEGEITDINNATFLAVNGIRENLRVLLVSGEPHAGERTWRNLLKSDAAVDLVHFTILRPPEKQDGTPINQLSLIAFPTRELFIQKINEFDLIIFDRYKRRGVLPVIYFDNIARYVRDGGAVLIAAGPEYAEPASIATTPLNDVLPAVSNGRVREEPFRPSVSQTGQRHPVTRELDGWDPEEPEWSRWFRSVGVDNPEGNVLLTNDRDEPVLMLQRHDEGRVALFVSDHVWLWARGFEGGGPHLQLLRRLAHWLMKEPELDEERLVAEADANRLTVTRQTLGDTAEPVEMTSPSGEAKLLELEQTAEGRWNATVEAEEIGLYRFSDNRHSALAQVGPANPRELAAVLSTGDLLEPLVTASRGAITRIGDGTVPRIVPVGKNATSAGRGWIGIVDSQASVLEGVFRLPLFAGLLGLALLVTAIGMVWTREGR